MTLQNDDFFDLRSAHEAPTYQGFSPFQFASNVNHRMFDIQFFGNFLCSSKRISFDNCSQFFIVNFQWLATMLLIFKALISFVKLLELHCTICSLSVPGQMHCWCCELSPMLYDLLWTQIKRSLKFSFCVISFL